MQVQEVSLSLSCIPFFPASFASFQSVEYLEKEGEDNLLYTEEKREEKKNKKSDPVFFFCLENYSILLYFFFS